MKFLLSFLLLLIFASSLHAQIDSLWSRTFGGSDNEFCRSVIQTPDGGYALAGYTASFGAGERDFWLVKTDSLGEHLWSRTFGGSDDDVCNALIGTTDGGYFLIGETHSFGASGSDWWLVKTDENGDSLWSRRFGGIGPEACNSVQQTYEGGYILAGSYGGQGGDVRLLKLSSSGDSLWSREYGIGQQFYSVLQTADGGYVVGGSILTHEHPQPDFDMWLVRAAANGDTLWTRSFGGWNTEICRSVQQTASGGYALAGHTSSYGSGGFDSWLVTTDSDGEALWTQTFGGEGSDGYTDVLISPDTPGTVDILSVGDNGSGGTGGGDFWMVATNAEGDSLWSRTFGGSGEEKCNSIQRTDDGGYILAGYTNSFGTGGFDFWLVKTGIVDLRVLTPNGGEHWEMQDVDTVRWYGSASASNIRIELNRDYPDGSWEILSEGVGNDGLQDVVVSEPLSRRCRIRVSTIDDEFSDVSDADFSIIPAVGHLAIVRPDDTRELVESWNAGIIDSPEVVVDTFRLMNVGGQSIVVFAPEIQVGIDFTIVHHCPVYFPLGSMEMSSYELILFFDPQSDGITRDTLMIQTDAANGDNSAFVRIPLEGERTALPVSPTHTINASVHTLHQNHPNPFNAQTWITFSLAAQRQATLTVHDALGRTVATLADNVMPAGRYTVEFDARHLSSGLYFSRLQVANQSVIKKMILIK